MSDWVEFEVLDGEALIPADIRRSRIEAFWPDRDVSRTDMRLMSGQCLTINKPYGDVLRALE